MKLREILVSKGSRVYSISPTETLANVIQSLVQHNCGALLVLDGEQVIGIISERDIIKACAELDDPLGAPVSACMHTEPITGSPEDDLEEVMGTMTNRRIRHIPIFEGSTLCGMISIGDVVKAYHDELNDENRLLKQYIQG